MSSSSYCQGLQSCLEPSRSGEPRVLRLKLSPAKSNISRSTSPRNPVSDSDTETNKKPEMGGWSFLQSLDGANNNDKVYIPPAVKRSSSMLNARSLEMCTESLGSETGSDVSDSSDEMTLTSPDINVKQENFENFKEMPRIRTRYSVMKRSASFPPPLSSMSGSTNVQFRPHREGGRLVLEAVSMTACRTYFQAERVNGRLKLHMLRNCSPKCENKEACIHVDETEKARNEVEEVESFDGEDEYEDIDGDDEDEDDEVGREELEGNKGEEEGQMGIEKLAKAMSSRCMEGGSCDGKALLNNKNWEAYCHVAS